DRAHAAGGGGLVHRRLRGDRLVAPLAGPSLDHGVRVLSDRGRPAAGGSAGRWGHRGSLTRVTVDRTRASTTPAVSSGCSAMTVRSSSEETTMTPWAIRRVVASSGERLGSKVAHTETESPGR